MISVVAMVILVVLVLTGAVLTYRGILYARADGERRNTRKRRLAELREKQASKKYLPHALELLSSEEQVALAKPEKILPKYLGDSSPDSVSPLERRVIAAMANQRGHTQVIAGQVLALLGGTGMGAYLVQGLRLPGVTGDIDPSGPLPSLEYFAFLTFTILAAGGTVISSSGRITISDAAVFATIRTRADLQLDGAASRAAATMPGRLSWLAAIRATVRRR